MIIEIPDPSHGELVLKPINKALAKTWPFQRLKRIRQLERAVLALSSSGKIRKKTSD